jgi:radical SAM-linked protein
LEIALAEVRNPEQLRVALDAALPPGLDVLTVVEAEGPGLPDRIDAGSWVIRLPGVDPARAAEAVEAVLAAPEIPMEKVTKSGRKTVDVRAALVRIEAGPPPGPTPAAVSQLSDPGDCAILGLVVRQTTPAVRPDDVMAAFRAVAGLEAPVPPEVTRLAQGRLTAEGSLVDPLDVADGARPVG